MARLAFALTVLLFFFALAYAELPRNDVADPDLSSSLPDSDANPAILLPVDKPDTEPFKTVESTPVEVEATESGEDLPVSNPQTEVRIFRIRPINRRFSHRGCRHAMFKQRRHEISFGNDMIMSGGEGEGKGKGLDPEMLRGGDRPIPARGMRFHRHGPPHREAVPWFLFNRRNNDDVVFVKHSFREPFRLQHEEHRHEKESEDREVEEKEEYRGRKEGGFLKHFRKFLNQFDF